MIRALVLLLILLQRVGGSSEETSSEECKYTKKYELPDVYYINMDKSVDRKIAMEKHLSEVGFNYYRVRGLKPSELFIPDDLHATWWNRWCLTDSEIPLPKHLDPAFPQHYNRSNIETGTPYKAIIRGLCGRKRDEGRNKGNLIKELGCTSSHLEAIRLAVYSNTTKSRYALIIEDDVHFPFEVDWNALAASAPPGFGILQLFNSNGGSMKATWKRYLRDKRLFVQRHPMKFFDFWSTCAYLIDRVAMKPVIDSVAYEANGWLNFKIVAGINNPCVPPSCCPANKDDFTGIPPCVWAPRGFQADSFLYAMTKTYMLSVPLITNGQHTDQSTFHQSHVGMLHQRAFMQQRSFINRMLKGDVAPPPYTIPACKEMEGAAIPT